MSFKSMLLPSLKETSDGKNFCSPILFNPIMMAAQLPEETSPNNTKVHAAHSTSVPNYRKGDRAR